MASVAGFTEQKYIMKNMRPIKLVVQNLAYGLLWTIIPSISFSVTEI